MPSLGDPAVPLVLHFQPLTSPLTGSTAIKKPDNVDVIEAVRSSHKETLQAFKDIHAEGATHLTNAATVAIDRQFKDAIEPKLQHLAKLIEQHGTRASSTAGTDVSTRQSRGRSDAPTSGTQTGSLGPALAEIDRQTKDLPTSPSSSTAANDGEGVSPAGSEVAQPVDRGTTGQTGGHLEQAPMLERLSQIEKMIGELHKASFQGEFPDDPNQVLGVVDENATPRIEALRAELLSAPDQLQATSAKLDSLVKALEDMPKQYGEFLKRRDDRFPFDRAFVNKFLALSMMLIFQAKHIKNNLGSLVDAVNGTDGNGAEGMAKTGLASTITKGLESVENQIKELYRVIDIPSIDALRGMVDARDKTLTQGIDAIAVTNQSTQKSIEGLQSTFSQLHVNLSELMTKMSQSSPSPSPAITCSCSCNKASTTTDPNAPTTPLDPAAAPSETTGDKTLPSAPPPKETPRQRQERLSRERAEADAKRTATGSETTSGSPSGPATAGAATAAGPGQEKPSSEAKDVSAAADATGSGNSIQGLYESIAKMSAMMEQVGSTIRGGQNTLYTTLLQQAEKIIHTVKPPSKPESEAEAAIRKHKEEAEALEKELRDKEAKAAAEAEEKRKTEAKQQRQAERMAGLQQISLILGKMDAFTADAASQGERVEVALASATEQAAGLQSHMTTLQTTLASADSAMAATAKASQAEKIEKGVEALATQQNTQHGAVMEQVKEILSTANDVYDAVEECKKLNESQTSQQAAMLAILEEWKKLQTEVTATGTVVTAEGKEEVDSNAPAGSSTPKNGSPAATREGGDGGGSGDSNKKDSNDTAGAPLPSEGGQETSPQEGNSSSGSSSTRSRRPLPPLPGHARALELLRMIETYLRDHVTSTVGSDGGSSKPASVAVDASTRPLSTTRGGPDESGVPAGSVAIDPLKDAGAERSATGGIIIPPTTTDAAAGASESLFHERFVAELADLALRYHKWSSSKEPATTAPAPAAPETSGPSSSETPGTAASAAVATTDDVPKVSRVTLENIRPLLPLEDHEKNVALLEQTKQENERLVKDMAEKEALVKERDDSIKGLKEQQTKAEEEHQNYRKEADTRVSKAESELAEEKKKCDEAVAKQKQKTRAAKDLVEQYVRAGLGIAPPKSEGQSSGGTESGPTPPPPQRGPLPIAQLLKEATEQLSQTMEELKEQRSILQREIKTLQEDKTRLLTSNTQLERCPCIHHKKCQHPLPLASGSSGSSSKSSSAGDEKTAAAPAAKDAVEGATASAEVSGSKDESKAKEEGGNDDAAAPGTSVLAQNKHQAALIACIGVEREGLQHMLLEHATPLTDELLSRAVLDSSEPDHRQWAFQCAFRIASLSEAKPKAFPFVRN
ncbi:hypothetical protein DFQ27_006007 [Actinomortierella ambigua]|uniref:Uncharacterized protein n=1 Tax=Actinomortierella ambigua TaxID=1343610 RepID=A0A9P6PXJ9_9FUNG|nr:hypothetical protein DFQ27_006007 [Actinomortierella ambigua]